MRTSIGFTPVNPAEPPREICPLREPVYGMRDAWDAFVVARRSCEVAKIEVAEQSLMLAYLEHVPERERKIAEAGVNEGQDTCCCCSSDKTTGSEAARAWCMAEYGWPK